MDKDKLKGLFKSLLSKKYIANLLVLMAIGVMALIVSSNFFMKDTRTKNIYSDPTENVLVQQNNQPMMEEEVVEHRLKEILQKIQGVGEVEVMVTFEMGTEIIPASNTTKSTDTTEEKDSGGGTRVVASENITETVVVANEGNGHKPLVLKEIKPQVNGVIVVAEGAENIEVKVKLYEAVKTVLQVPGHKVEVYSKK
ncbi:stage III sporulation protein AG [Clostridium aceticum]|uniref:Stage III sporulation protein AG n=1 Tax=Clostridium aceticum TaxID=84022 RepID=A0A0D8IFY9_9CLOT|nr:stage III sporulation protein AG [Clostridium aceticum]AKL95296.1 stage III sporulation protein AG [Clostridium aceticum]KJF28141.1 sporulation protein [Clostridium aceticum]